MGLSLSSQAWKSRRATTKLTPQKSRESSENIQLETQPSSGPNSNCDEHNGLRAPFGHGNGPKPLSLSELATCEPVQQVLKQLTAILAFKQRALKPKLKEHIPNTLDLAEHVQGILSGSKPPKLHDKVVLENLWAQAIAAILELNRHLTAASAVRGALLESGFISSDFWDDIAALEWMVEVPKLTKERDNVTGEPAEMVKLLERAVEPWLGLQGVISI